MIKPFLNKWPIIGQNCYIDDQALLLGNVTLGQDVSIWPMAVVRGDVNNIVIGDRTNIQDGAILHVTHDGLYTPGGAPLIIGSDITIGHQAMLHACIIEDFCLIGMSTIILDDVYIEHHTMVAAGSVVPPGKRLHAKHLYLGNPVKCIRPLTEEEILRLEYSAAHYVRLKNSYLNTQYVSDK